MDLVKIGEFIKRLRKEKGDTQEDIADKFYVSRRTVSRWETGANLPDIDILIELANYFNVDLHEILNGGIKNNMDDNVKETAINVNEYNKENFKRTKIVTFIFLILGVFSLTMGIIVLFIELPESFWYGFLKGTLFGTAFSSMIIAIHYITGLFDKFARMKYNLLHKKR